MRFTLSWLKEFLDTDASVEEIAESLTAIGLELEGLDNPAETFAPFKVAYVESAEKHPDADKLKVCQVKTENGIIQVVCGAPNARTGMKGIFAPDNTYIPGLDVTLKKTKIRGVESCGMLVSEKEMCLSEDHQGIIEVDDSHEIGAPMADIFGLNDPVFEINVTPNRPDCAGIYGIARDLAAAGLGTLKPIQSEPINGSFESSVQVTIDDTEGCPLFLGYLIKGVKNGPSPDWLQRQLKAVGLRPISALVDVTNYFTLSYARPLHVYDADKLQGNIVVGTSKGGEELEALNDKSYTMLPGAVTINDESSENGGVIGFGGIVGGTSTGSEEDTVNVFLEAAYFDPVRTARTGRDHQIITDARYRFERGIDPEFTFTGIDLAAKMIQDICGGDISQRVQAGETPEWKRTIDYDPSYTEQLIGVDVPADRQKEILEALGFEVGVSSRRKPGSGDCKNSIPGQARDDKVWTITPPPWRPDVYGKADITEEVIRIFGFESIPENSVEADATVPSEAETLLLSRARKARAALAARGLNECVTWSFTSQERAENFGANDNLDALTLVNPISSELDVMRPSILPNLIEAALNNANRGYADVALSEVGPVFVSTKPEGQDIVAAGIRAGSYSDRHWSDGDAHRPVDVFDAKADAFAALEVCGAPTDNAPISRDAPSHYHPGRSGCIRLGKNVIAQFGEIHPSVLEEIDIKGPVVGFEVFLENIPQPKKKGTEKPYLTLEPLQPLTRDFAFLVDEAVEVSDMLRASKGADKALIISAEIFDVYQGKGVEDGKKSVALTIQIQPKGETLTDEQIEELMSKVIENVQTKTGGVLRG